MSTYKPSWPNAGKCAGEEFAAFSGIGVLTSYLVLFISFYIATYAKEGPKDQTRKTLRRMSQAPVPDPHDLLSKGPSLPQAEATGAKVNGSVARSRKA